jgi:hypothetical protein
VKKALPMFGQLLETEITDPWQLSGQFLGFITTALKQSKTQSIMIYNHGKKKSNKRPYR